MTTKRLYRSRTQQMLAGICGGIAELLGIDIMVVRLCFMVLVLLNGIGFFIYLVLWIGVPYQDQNTTALEETMRSNAAEIAARARMAGDDLRLLAQTEHARPRMLVGGLLTLFGVVFLIQNLNITWLLWPIVLIVGGVVLLWRRGEGA